METVLRIIAVLSFLAFVVGMFKPATVMCKSRGKVALVYLVIFIISVFIGVSIMESNSTLKGPNEERKVAEKVEEKPVEIPILSTGSVYTMKYGNADVKITFENIQVKRLPKGRLNLIFSLIIKNNSNDIFFISNCDWKLLDADKIEVKEAGVYEPMFDDFAPSMFFFTTVHPNVGKKEQVGYSVKEETYYLSINGKIIAQIPLDQKE